MSLNKHMIELGLYEEDASSQLDFGKAQPWEQEGCVFKKCCKKYKKKGKKQCKSCPKI